MKLPELTDALLQLDGCDEVSVLILTAAGRLYFIFRH